MVFNATFNNISAILQQLSLLARAVLVKTVDHVKMPLLTLYVFVQLDGLDQHVKLKVNFNEMMICSPGVW
jgi:hypothetical protein